MVQLVLNNQIFRCFWNFFNMNNIMRLFELTSAFIFRIAGTVIWFCWWNLSSWIKMEIAADCLLLFFSWGAISFEKECFHWKFNICSKNSLHNIQSVQDNSVRQLDELDFQHSRYHHNMRKVIIEAYKRFWSFISKVKMWHGCERKISFYAAYGITRVTTCSG